VVGLIAVALGIHAMVAPAGHAAVVRALSVDDDQGGHFEYEFVAGRGEENSLRISADPPSGGFPYGAISFRDLGARRMVASADGCRRVNRARVSCRPVDPIEPTVTVKTLDGDDHLLLQLSAATQYTAEVLMGSGDDRLRAPARRYVNQRLFGGQGNDYIEARNLDSIGGPDIDGGSGNDLIRVPRGAAQISAGSGNDTIVLRTRAWDTSVECGPGRDSLLFVKLFRHGGCERLLHL
jgi:hypothetical protein